MDAIGINPGILLIQAIPVILFIGLPIIALIDLAKKKMSGTPLALWVLIICAIPAFGAIAYWIVKPTPENKV
ncbi:MAG TPA: PLDc N-terminal domain-containing protein [Anaerolineales bacterium]